MKKSLFLVLVLGIMLVFAACGTDGENASGTDIAGGEKAPDPDAPITEDIKGSVEDITNALGITVTLPNEYQLTRYAVIDDIQGQVEFLIGENQAVARVAKGQQTNMSELTGEFANTETVDINGVSAQVRYPNAGTESNYAADSMGVIDAYNAGADLSYSVVMLSNATKDELVAAMTALIAGTTAAQ